MLFSLLLIPDNNRYADYLPEQYVCGQHVVIIIIKAPQFTVQSC